MAGKRKKARQERRQGKRSTRRSNRKNRRQTRRDSRKQVRLHRIDRRSERKANGGGAFSGIADAAANLIQAYGESNSDGYSQSGLGTVTQYLPDQFQGYFPDSENNYRNEDIPLEMVSNEKKSEDKPEVGILDEIFIFLGLMDDPRKS